MSKKFSAFVLAAALALPLSLPHAASAASTVDDEALARQVTEAIGPFKSDVTIRVHDGAVTLSVLVSTTEERDFILERVGLLPDVTALSSNLDLGEHDE